MISIDIGGPQASAELKARRTLEGNLLILDHDQIDIVVFPEMNKIMAFPKEETVEDAYPAQNRLFEYLANHGICPRDTIRGGNLFNSLEATFPESPEVNTLQAALYAVAEFLTVEAEAMAAADQYKKDVEKNYLYPSDQDSTELGEVPQYAEKGAMRPGYYYIPLRYRY